MAFFVRRQLQSHGLFVMLFLKYLHISNRASLLTASMRKFQEQNETFQANRARMAEGLALALARKDQVFDAWHCPELVGKSHVVTCFQNSCHKPGSKYLQSRRKGLCYVSSLRVRLAVGWEIIQKLYSCDRDMCPYVRVSLSNCVAM